METMRVSRQRFQWGLYLLGYAFFAMQLPAAYKVVLQDGTVFEARSKPISMQGSYWLSAPDGRFLMIPLEQVDIDATKAANRSVETAARPKVITNEDMSPRPPEPALGGIPATGPAPQSAREPVDRQESPTPPLSEAYWREAAGVLRQQITETDAMLASLKAEIEKEEPYCGTGLEVLEVEECTLLPARDRGPELRAVEARKKALEAEFELLEERGRKAGALPGWFR